MAAACAFGGYEAVLMLICYQLQIPLQEITVQELKREATGMSDASKDEVESAAFDRWNHLPIDDNEADAMWVTEACRRRKIIHETMVVPASVTDLTGEHYGKLTVIGYKGIGTSRAYRWLVKCECGNMAVCRASNLKKSKSCFKCKNIKHGMVNSSTYKSWCMMLTRCNNPNYNQYKDYGGRGISVCARWSGSFQSFLEDMGERPRGTSIDRKDNDGNYEPSNCCWATSEQQAQNRRTTRLATYASATLSLSAWSRLIGVSLMTIRKYVDQGNTIEDIVIHFGRTDLLA
jgi:hypothetical protein